MQVSHRSTAPLLLLMLATACAERPSAPTAPSTEPSRVALDASAGAPPPSPPPTAHLPTPTASLWPLSRFGFGVQSYPVNSICFGPAGPPPLRAPPPPL